MIRTLSQFWSFLKAPYLLKLNKDKASLRQDFIWLLMLDIVFAIVVGLTVDYLIKLKLIKEYKDFDTIKEYGIYVAVFIACVMAPLLEEIMFRWHLRKRYASIYFLTFTVAAILILYVENGYIKSLIFVILLVLAMFVHYLLKKLSQTKKQLLWRKCFPFIFYSSALFFGLIHLTNYEGITIKDPFVILYVCSQIIGGLSLGYLRIKYGLKYSILYHAAFNATILPIWLLFH